MNNEKYVKFFAEVLFNYFYYSKKKSSNTGIIISVEIFIDAGAIICNSSCGVCFGGHQGILAAGERCITTTPRNFRGRMGSIDSEVYLGSPATVAAAAIAGEIVDLYLWHMETGKILK